MSSPPAVPVFDSLRLVDLLRLAVSRFEAAGLFYGHGTTCALDEAAALVLGALQLPPDLPDGYFDARLTAAEVERLYELIERRVEERIPVPYLLGECWYAGQKFAVSTEVLVPRSPLFELIAAQMQPWLDLYPQRILDLCTGSGCLAVLLAQAFADVPVDASDLSAAALAVARRNITRHGLGDQVTLLEGDGLAACKGRAYDLIVSNPPYVPAAEYAGLPAEYGHEPRMGLEAGDDGLAFVHRLLAEVSDALNPGGVLICEVGSAAGEIVTQYPDWPWTWLEFAQGGDGVFLIRREDILAAQNGNAHVG